jgi:hypothetical protein
LLNVTGVDDDRPQLVLNIAATTSAPTPIRVIAHDLSA